MKFLTFSGILSPKCYKKVTECDMIIDMNVEDQIFKQMNETSRKDNRLCFTPKHFINIASYNAVKKALERLVKSDKVRRKESQKNIVYILIPV